MYLLQSRSELNDSLCTPMKCGSNCDHYNTDHSQFHKATSCDYIRIKPELGNLKTAKQPNYREERISQIIFHTPSINRTKALYWTHLYHNDNSKKLSFILFVGQKCKYRRFSYKAIINDSYILYVDNTNFIHRSMI